MSNLELPGTLNFSPAEDFTQLSVPSSLYSHEPATHSMISGAPVLNVSVAGSTTPTDFFVPSGKVMPWLTHLPSKYTLAWVVTDTPSIFSVVMDALDGLEETRDFRPGHSSPAVAPSGVAFKQERQEFLRNKKEPEGSFGKPRLAGPRLA